jgi:hypothetical protein
MDLMIKSLFSKFCIIVVLLVISHSTSLNCQTIEVVGTLFDKGDGKSISGGIIFLNPGNQVITSNFKGEFSFVTLKGRKQIVTRVLGYKLFRISFEATSDTIINIGLEVSPFELGEVTITSDYIKNINVTHEGTLVITPVSVRETPKVFSEPDLLKSLQLMPGVISGKEGTSSLYIRGGSAGQNIILTNGCYFFLPGHLLGILSPFDLDFLASAKLYKDYLPAEIGGGASSVLSLEFRKPHKDSIVFQARLGLLSSGINIDLAKKNWDLSIGVKKSNYSIYSPILKKIVPSDISNFLPPNKYSFYDGFIRLSHFSPKWGNVSYLFFGNYDNSNEEKRISGQRADTVTNYIDGISSGWNSMVHAIQWDPLNQSLYKWKFNLNYNRIAIGRKMYTRSEESSGSSATLIPDEAMYTFYPTMNNFGISSEVSCNLNTFSFLIGISDRLRLFKSNNISINKVNNIEKKNDISTYGPFNETSFYVSSGVLIGKNVRVDAGLRLTEVITKQVSFLIPEPRLRITLNEGSPISEHLNYVRLSQSDHSIEGSNAGLRTMLWLAPDKDFGPEISDVLSAGFHGKIKNDFSWIIEGYYKMINGMVDFKPGASLIFDTTFADLLNKVQGKAYGLEAGIIKNTGNLTGSISYTYSRSKMQWDSSVGMIWIPSTADRPHNVSIMLKYHLKERTSFGLNFVYQSGVPATIYMHETSYGEFFETKNNIRYFDYHRLDLSLRQIIYKRKLTIFLDIDIYNIYNHKNTFYFRKTYDPANNSYYYENICLFPVMPSLTLTVKY